MNLNYNKYNNNKSNEYYYSKTEFSTKKVDHDKNEMKENYVEVDKFTISLTDSTNQNDYLTNSNLKIANEQKSQKELTIETNIKLNPNEEKDGFSPGSRGGRYGRARGRGRGSV